MDARRRFAIVLMALGAMLSGCAATGLDYAQAERTLASMPADGGRIYFYRDSSIVGAAIQPLIYLDARQIGRSQPGGFFVVDVASGEHVVTSTTEAETRLTLAVREGQTLYVSSSIGLGLIAGRVSLQIQPEGVARSALASLKMTGAAPSQSVSGSNREVQPAAAPGLRQGPVTLDDLSGLLPPRK